MLNLSKKLRHHHYRMSADIRFLLRAFLTLLLIQQLIRAALMVSFAEESLNLPMPILAEALFLGLRFDIMLSTWVCIPMILACALPSSLRARSLWRAWLTFMGFVTICTGLISIELYQIEGTEQRRSFYLWLAQGDAVPWNELLARWETLIWLAYGIFLTGLLNELIKASDLSCRFVGRDHYAKRSGIFFILFLLSLLALRGSIYWGPPLKPEAAQFSSYHHANHIAANATFTLSRQRLRMAENN